MYWQVYIVLVPLVQFKLLGMMLKSIPSITSVGSLHSTIKVSPVVNAIFVMVGAWGEAREKWEEWNITKIYCKCTVERLGWDGACSSKCLMRMQNT